MIRPSSFGLPRLVAVGGLLAGLAGFSAAPATAQDRGVHGRVTDAATGQPVGEAEVSVVGMARRAATDATGAYQLAALPAGTVELRVRRVGFAPMARRVTVGVGQAEVNFQLTAAATELAPVVVTATRDARSAADVPAAVSVVDSTVLQSTRSAGLQEVLRYTPGVLANSRYGLDDVNLSIRGSGIRTTFGVRGVAVLVDGVPVTEPDGTTRLDLIELASTKQVEVVRGPASALYGGAASGGAINIISKSGAESRGVLARVQQGSYGFQKYDGQLGSTFDGDNGSVLISGAHTFSRGFRVLNRNDMTRFNLRSAYRVSPTTSVGIEGSTSNLDMNIPGALTQAEFAADPYAAAPVNIVNNYARRDKRFRTGARLDQALVLGRPIETTTYAFFGGRILDHPIYQVLSQDLKRTQLGTRLRMPIDRAENARVRFAAGVDYDRLYGRSSNYQNVGGNRGTLLADGRQSLPSLGTYGQLEAQLTERLAVTGGLRYDRVQYNIDDYLKPSASIRNTYSQWSPKGTVTYRLAAGTSAYGSVSRGFEVPTSTEFSASPDPNQPFNTGLTPKTLTNYEVGLKTLLANRLALDVAVFNADIRGEFLSRTVATSTGPRTVFENAGRSRNRGVELGLTALATPWLDVVASYALSDFVLRDFQALTVQSNGTSQMVDYSGKALPGVPRHRVAGQLRFHPVDGLTAGVGAEWQSKAYVDNANADAGTVYYKNFGSPVVQAAAYGAVRPYALVHLNASYRLAFATLFANVENLFDKQYVGSITVNDGTGRFYSAGAGRYLAAGLSFAAFQGGF